MVLEKLKEKLYEAVVKEPELTTQALKEYGIGSKDINKLIESGELSRVKRGFYELTSVDSLYSYAKKMKNEKRYDECYQYFFKCYELNPNHNGVCFQLFFNDINNEQFDSAVKYFDTLLGVSNKFYLNDMKYYLYLMSFIVELPKKLQYKVKKLTIDNFEVSFDDNRYTKIFEQNKSRRNAYYQKFSVAFKILNSIIQENGKVSQSELIAKKLLYAAVAAKKNDFDKRLDLIKNKEYELLYVDLQREADYHQLSINNGNLLTLVEEYLNIKNTSNIPSPGKLTKNQLLDKDGFFFAIEQKNYKLALKLLNQYLERKNFERQNLVQLMLTDLVNLIEEVEKSNSNQEEIALEKTQVLDSTQIFVDIVNGLLINDVDTSIEKLHKYLVSIGKEEYEFIITDLIKISILEKDMTFSKPIMAFTNIIKADFKYDVSSYVETFYDCLQQGKFSEARVYLDIIEKSKDFVIIDGLVDSLNKTLGLFDKENKIIVKEELREKTKPIVISNPVVSNEQKTIDITKDEDYKLLKEKMKVLDQEKGIVLLDPMDSKHRKKIHGLVKEFPNMRSFSIGKDDERRIVLKYFNPEYVDVTVIKEKIVKELKKKNYARIIDLTKVILAGPKPYIVNFLRVGEYYNRLGEFSKSLDYLTVAYELYKQDSRLNDEDRQMVIQDLINKTKEKISQALPKEEIKEKQKEEKEEVVETPKVEAKLETKKQTKSTTNNKKVILPKALNDYYGIDKIDEVSILVNDMKLSITDACSKCGLTEEETTIVRLIFARDYYARGSYESGDKLLKVAQKSQNKTDRVKDIIEEVRVNKMFYKNREQQGKKLLKSLNVKN